MTDGDRLLAAVCAAPEDDLPRLVYADWLDEHGDPARAEFIRVQCDLARAATPDLALQRREAELLAEHGEAWRAPFVRFTSYMTLGTADVTFRRGFAWGLVLEDEDDEFADAAAELFRLAPVERIAFLLTYSHTNRAACPELRRLRELGVDRCGYETDVLAELLASPHLGNLVRLELTADDDNGHLDADGLRLLGDCPNLPGLRELDLSGNWCGWMYDNDEWVRHLLAGDLAAGLAWLSLHGTDFGDRGAELLAASDRVRRLVHLDLSNNTLTGAGMLALARSPHLVSLRTLDLRSIHTFDPEHDKDAVPPAAARAELVARFGGGVLLDG